MSDPTPEAVAAAKANVDAYLAMIKPDAALVWWMKDAVPLRAALTASEAREAAQAERIAALEVEVKGLREVDEGVYAEAVDLAVKDCFPVIAFISPIACNMLGRKLVRRIPEVAAEFAERAKARAALDGKAVGG